MKIMVCVKQVASRDSLLEVRDDGRWIDDEDLDFEVNEPDAYALEAGLKLKEEHGGEVIVVCLGPDRLSKSIKECLAKGADRAIHVELDNPEEVDTLATARLLAKAIELESPDLVLSGLQSDDLGGGQCGVMVAELMGVPHGSIVMAMEKTDSGLRIRRELEGGYFQNVDLPLPAALSIQSGISKLRYATLMGIKKARSKEVKRLDADALGVDLTPLAETVSVYAPERTKQTFMIEGDAATAAQTLVDKLKHEARAL
jgi:electron transfer flavoprotein beta subunit